MNVDVPLVGDFHYIGHTLLANHPGCAEALDKYRINPGNVGFGKKKDTQFSSIVEMAIKHNKPVRIGANWGSLDQELLTQTDGREHRVGEPDGRARGDARGDGAVGADFGRARRGDRPAARQDHPLGEGLGRAGPDRGLSRTRPPLELRDPPRPHRSRHGLEGHRRLERGARRADAAGHRRHHPHFARRPSRAATARSR